MRDACPGKIRVQADVLSVDVLDVHIQHGLPSMRRSAERRKSTVRHAPRCEFRKGSPTRRPLASSHDRGRVDQVVFIIEADTNAAASPRGKECALYHRRLKLKLFKPIKIGFLLVACQIL